jgi:glycosyltransferase involved in cell wall biosynthesis
LVSSFPPVKGGESSYAQNFVSALEKYFAKEISEIHVLCHSEGEKSNKYEKNGKVQIFRLFNSLSFLGRNFAFIKIFLKILDIRPDIVHMEYSTIPNGRYGGVLGESLFILFILLKLMRIPSYITMHSLWLPDQAEDRMYEKVKNRAAAKIAKAYLKIFMYLFGRLPQKLFLLVNIRGSSITKEFCRAYHIPLERVKEEIHGIQVQQGTVRTALAINSRVMVCLGVINPSKGYEFAIMAMKYVLEKFPDSSLIIAGSPPPTNYDEGRKYIQKLHDTITECGIYKSVRIVEKYLSDDEFAQYVRTAAIVIVSYSRTVATSGIMNAAMMHKVPAIVTGSGIHFEELSDFISIVPPRNPQALAEEIIKILGSKDYREILINNYERYLTDHDWRLVTRDIYEEYVINQQPKRTNPE